MKFQIFEKKKFFKRLQNQSLKKKSKFLKKWKKNAFFPFHIYGSKMAKNDFFCVKPISWKSSKYLVTFSCANVFHTTNSFGCKNDWNFNFFENFENFEIFKIFKKLKISIASTAKKNARMKNLALAKKFQNTLNFCMKPVSCEKKSFLAILEP